MSMSDAEGRAYYEETLMRNATSLYELLCTRATPEPGYDFDPAGIVEPLNVRLDKKVVRRQGSPDINTWRLRVSSPEQPMLGAEIRLVMEIVDAHSEMNELRVCWDVHVVNNGLELVPDKE